MTSADIAILGAGPAGLAAAYRLAARGLDVIVLERNDHVGGLAASFEVTGQRVDHGSHRLHASTPPDILDFLRSRLGDELQSRPRNGRIRLHDRWLAFPLGIGDLARGLPLGFVGRAGLSALGAAIRPRRTTTFEDAVRTGLGRVMGEAFYFPYARKIWGIDPDELSGEQARRRISADSAWKLARRVLARRDGRFFFYPRGGFGRIAEVVAEAASEAGARIELQADVRGIDTGASFSIRTRDGRQIEAGRLWSTIPVAGLARLVEPRSWPPLESRAMVLVYVVVPRPQYTVFDAHYLPDETVSATRISEPKNYRDGDDPADRTVLCAEIPCTVGDVIWSATDDELAELVSRDLVASDLPDPATADVVVRRVAHAYPIYRLGFASTLRPMLDAIDRAQIISFGRQGLFAHDNTHHAFAMAWAAADAADVHGHVDSAAWSTAMAGFRRHTVED